MVINTTRYSPDTCDCVIEYTWDSTVAADQRTHTLSNYVNKCSAHAGLATDQDRWNAVFEENPRKNNAFQICLDNGPTGIYDIDIESGTRKLKNGVIFTFSWSGTAPNRVLSVTFTGSGGGALTTQQKNSIQTFLNNKFGVGKVLIV